MTARQAADRSSPPCDLLVIGGGTAGIVGATTAARLGAKVVLVERERPGGDCLWTGCVPTKSLLAAGAVAAGARRAAALGVSLAQVSVDFDAVMDHVRGAITAIAATDSPDALRAAGVDVVLADAAFVGPRRAMAGGRPLAFHHALVATGSVPLAPDLPGLARASPLTTDSVWGLTNLPGRLLVVGGGTTGCELSQAFARLGSHVTLVESAPTILPEEDPDAAALVHDALAREGVRVLVGHRMIRVASSNGRRGQAMVDDGHREVTLAYEELLVAVGRRPNTAGLALSAAGVHQDLRGAVIVSSSLRTSNPRIWAAGDVTAHPRFTHVAGVHAATAAANAVLGLRRKVERSQVPRVTFTDPEVARVGAPSWSERGGSPPRTVTRRLEDVDRAVVEGGPAGFARLVLDGRRRVVGATVVAPRAGECLAELSLAVHQKLKVRDLASAMHAYPTFADAQWNAAVDEVYRQLTEPPARQLTQLAVRLRRRWRQAGDGLPRSRPRRPAARRRRSREERG